MSLQANFQYEHRMGTIYGWFSPRGLQHLHLPYAETGAERRSVLHSSVNDSRVWALHAALERYFAGLSENFDAIPIDVASATEFQQEVWQAARCVPWGSTSTYGALAKSLGKDKGSARAVGHALGQNPLAILIPCHRILAANGSLTGYAAGLEWKRELLRVEGALLA